MLYHANYVGVLLVVKTLEHFIVVKAYRFTIFERIFFSILCVRSIPSTDSVIGFCN